MESVAEAAEALKAGDEDSLLSQGFDSEMRSMVGSKQMQSKMVLDLMRIDPESARVRIEAWRTMADTTSKKDKDEPFVDMEGYLEYRILDMGTPFVDEHMCFVMGIVLSEEALQQVGGIAHAAYAALGLANDYFSFDVEYEEFRKNDRKAMTNAVWLFMHWNGADITEAKRMAREETISYERRFLRLQREAVPSLSPKLRGYVQGLAYQIAGNVVWNTDNPRHHPEKDIYKHDKVDFDRSSAIYNRQTDSTVVTAAVANTVGHDPDPSQAILRHSAASTDTRKSSADSSGQNSDI